MSIKPARLVLGPPVIDYEPGWAERAGAVGYPDAKRILTEALADYREKHNPDPKENGR